MFLESPAIPKMIIVNGFGNRCRASGPDNLNNDSLHPQRESPMRNIKKTALCCAIGTLSLGMHSLAHAAVALEEVVVSARKQMEVVQDVPVAITAITADTFERAAIGTFEEATALTPGFKVNASSFSPLAPNLSLRGS